MSWLGRGQSPQGPAETPPRWTRVRVIFSHFEKDVRKQRRKLAAGTCFAVIYALARVAEPWPLKVVFDQVLFHKPANSVWTRPFTVLPFERIVRHSRPPPVLPGPLR